MQPPHASTTAQAIYSAVYGHLDDKEARRLLLAEIEDWLIEGASDTPDRSIASLAAEWREYTGDRAGAAYLPRPYAIPDADATHRIASLRYSGTLDPDDLLALRPTSVLQDGPARGIGIQPGDRDALVLLTDRHLSEIRRSYRTSTEYGYREHYDAPWQHLSWSRWAAPGAYASKPAGDHWVSVVVFGDGTYAVHDESTGQHIYYALPTDRDPDPQLIRVGTGAPRAFF